MNARAGRPPIRSAASAVLAALALSACAGAATSPRIQLDTARDPHAIEVVGLPAGALARLAARSPTDDEWRALLRVTVGGEGGPEAGDLPAVAGRYAVDGEVLRFTPLFPLDPGRQYRVRFDPSRLAAGGSEAGREGEAVEAVVRLRAAERSPSTVVTHVYPSADALPANQLRLYLHFSAPMGLRGGLDHVRLLDDRGAEVADVFLPIEADYWNEDRTRYTLFFDPGRVKRGILPNRQMGRALEPGRRYTLVVSSDWRDGHGQPLKSDFRRQFTAGEPVEAPLEPAAWSIDAPRASTRDPVAVEFPAPLDHGLLQRALWVWSGGESLAGEARIEAGERRWSFVPRDPWRPGEHQLVALSILEDVAGNRIGRAFEVDEFDRTDRTAAPERVSRPFMVRPPTTP